MISNCELKTLKPYLLWAARERIGMHCKTTRELAEILSYGRAVKSINFVAINIAKAGKSINLDVSPDRDPNVDWFAQHWPFIAQQDGYSTYP